MTSAGMSAQESYPGLGFWKFKSITGELSVMGQYQEQGSQFNDIIENQNSKYLIGGIKLNTSSFLWQPDIFALNIGGEYNPESRNEQYLTIPDRSEVRTLKKLDLRSTIFSDKSITLTPYFNIHQNYFNRENLTNVRSNNRQWGGILSLNNSFLPLTISYRSLKWNQTETESGRQFEMNQNSLQGRISKSFYGVDKHNLTYAYDDYLYTYSDLNAIQNKVHRVTLNDQFYFDQDKNYAYHSVVNYFNQEGNHSFNKLEASERLIFHLPANLDFNAAYNYYRMEDLSQLINSNRIKGMLKHQLYESLTSEIFTDYSRTNHTVYNENDLKTGVEFNYTKKIPLGQINLGYRYFRQYNTVESEETTINIRYEEHTLSDLVGQFLAKPYVDAGSVVVTDVSGSIMYQEGLDYLVDNINNYAEIFRIPGGQIEQGQEVRISYSAIQPASNHYEANNNSINANLLLLNRLLSIYYKGSVQNFDNVQEADFLTLNQYTQNVVGARIYYKIVTGGIEYDYYNSSIIPYKRLNYFLNMNFKIKSRIVISLNSTLRDYILIGNDVNHRYINVSGRFAYKITRNSKLNVQAGYLSQNGKNIDLDLLTGRLEFITNLRKMYLTTGMNFYSKHYSNSDFTYTRAYVQLARKF
jgi:hypothetical protein